MKTLYGLPEEVKFCKRCVISNQRPASALEYLHNKDSKKVTIAFGEDGICDACRFAERKKSIDWADRERQLVELCNQHRSRDGSYDCLVPGSGGKDSFYQAHVLKYKYGMHPLTITWAPNIYTPWGRRNHARWIAAGFDNILVTPNERTHRLITRLAVENLFHPFFGFIIAQKHIGAKFAAMYNIKLTIYGEGEAEYGNPIADNSTAMRDKSYYTYKDLASVHLGGVPYGDLIGRYGLTAGDLSMYLPPTEQQLDGKDITVQYLGYYLKWKSQDCFYYAVKHGGFEAAPERSPGSWSRYSSIDDYIDDYHYLCTYYKFGIGRATYDACQEIRNEDIDRDEGVALVKKFDGEYPERSSDIVMRYLSITPDEFPNAYRAFCDPMMTKMLFLEMAERFKSPHLWDGNKLRHTVWAP